MKRPALLPMAATSQEPDRTALLEELFIMELKIVTDIYGGTTEERRAWAERRLPPGDEVDHYLSGWTRGKRAAWKTLAELAVQIVRLTGDTQAQWEERLTRMELMAGRELLEALPSTTDAIHDTRALLAGG